MEYAQMMKEPGLISGLSVLLKDTDTAVVKRTIRVFANVYRHSLQFLAKGNLDEPTFSKAWPVVHNIGNQLVEMLKNAENEGVIIHIIRFLEASLVAKLLSDISRYPHIASKMGETINVGIKSLKDLLMLPYVGGSTFIVGIRSLITIACYKSNIRKEVVDLIDSLIAKPPPTLFDHHVRSLHKVLQRNLFRLLRREESPDERERLVDMMVKVGVPRRMLSQWAPQSSGRKRSSESDSNSDNDSDSSAQSHKKRKYENKDLRTPPLPGLPPDSLPSLPPGSPPALPPGSPPALPPALPPGTQPPLPPGSPPPSGSSQRFQDIPDLSWKDSGASHFDQLKMFFSNTRSKKTSTEEIIYEALENPDVVELVMTCIDEVSDAHVEEELLAKLAKAGDENAMKETLSCLLVRLLPKSIIDAIHCDGQYGTNKIRNIDLKDKDNPRIPSDPRLSHRAINRTEQESSLNSQISNSNHKSNKSNNIEENVFVSQNSSERGKSLSNNYSDLDDSSDTNPFVAGQQEEHFDNSTSNKSQSVNNFMQNIHEYDHTNNNMTSFNDTNQMSDNTHMGNRQMPVFNGPRGMFDNSCNFNNPSNMNPRMGMMLMPPRGGPPPRMGPPMNGTPFNMGRMGARAPPGLSHLANGMVQVPRGPHPGQFMGGLPPPPMMPNANHWMMQPDMTASLHLPMNSQSNIMNRTAMRM
ncbi:unnamed protein product [Meganyctiphanes norvegica]|uniref:Symplekin/Pta1 N-terminal domain-containing protein n=1 Tax=Meganyctiphanes norvegica TaxID=48144 RepID=A0AAV2Q1H5_MEGNR